jgi:hypothetical protein
LIRALPFALRFPSGSEVYLGTSQIAVSCFIFLASWFPDFSIEVATATTARSTAEESVTFVVNFLRLSYLDSRAPACSPLLQRLCGLPGDVPDRRVPAFLVSRLIVREKKMPDIDLTIASGILVDVQQRLNCALLVVSSSLDFFRYRGLNSMS